jgi:hypothetical protein
MYDMQVNQPFTPEICPQCKRPAYANTPFCQCGFDVRHGTPHRKKYDVCIYCPAAGRVKLTDEHMYGRWLLDIFPKSPLEKSWHLLRRPERHEFFATVPQHERAYEVRGHPYFTTVLNVCEDCNGGWMSELQNQTKELVLRLACGEWPEFSKEESFILARWVAMVTINLESYSRQKATTQAQRDALKAGGMPDGWRIGICRMAHALHAGMHDHRKMSPPIGIGDGNFLPIQSTFFCIENISFHSLSSVGNMTLAIGMMDDLNPSIFTERKIWPNVEAVSVGATTLYSRNMIEKLQNRFKVGH